MPRIEPPHQPGDRVLRDYEIQELIGSGGHAFVYRARCIAGGEEVAIKVIPEQPGRITNVRERAKREALALVRLDHPNIVKVITGGETKGITYIVMEMMQGKVLRDVIHDVQRLSVHEALSIAVQVAEGMLEAHRLNVIHRDLKPENVFVLKENRAKILDFGIAKFMGYGYESTQRDMVHGTVTYMSPEQLQGFGVTDKSDVYALGTVLWEMIAGYPPVLFGVQEISMMAISHRQLAFVAPSLDEIHPEVPGYVARLVRRSLAKQAAQRETSEQFLASLRHALQRLTQEQAPAVLLNRELLTAEVSPLLVPKRGSSSSSSGAATARSGTPKTQLGPGGTEVMHATLGPEAGAAEAIPKATDGQGFPTVYGVPLFHPAADSDMTRVPVSPPVFAQEGDATADEPEQPEQPQIQVKDCGPISIEPSLSMTSTATWVAPLVPKWLVAASAGALVGGVFFFPPQTLIERWAPWLMGHSLPTSSAELTLESAKPDPDAVLNTATLAQNPTSPASPHASVATPRAQAQTIAGTEAPVAATLPTVPVPTKSDLARAKRTVPKESRPGRTSRPPSSPAAEPSPAPPASAQSWVRMHPEGNDRYPLWIESPREREARKNAEEQKPSPSKAPASASSQPTFDPEELIFE